MSDLFDNKQMNTMAVRRINELRLLNLLYRRGELTNLELKEELGLSAPTITQAVQKYRQMGYLTDGEELESSGGRKSRCIAFRYDAACSVGVEIRPHHVEVAVIDLKGRVMASELRQQTFENTPTYWSGINGRIREMLETTVKAERVLGVGIAFPGEVSFNGDLIQRATVLGLRDEPLDNIKRHFDYDVYIENGASAAGFGAIWRDSAISDAVYTVVTDNGVAGAIILDNRIYRGSGKAGAFGHMTLDPHGRPCFCGARGCWTAYSALSNLADLTDGDLDRFFAEMRAGDLRLAAAWDEYLNYLAHALGNLLLGLDLDVIIGGKLVRYLKDDLVRLQEKVRAHPVLRNEAQRIRVDDIEEHTLAVGAALLMVGKLFMDAPPAPRPERRNNEEEP